MKNQFKTITVIVLFFVLNLPAMSTVAQDDVSVPLGDIPAGQQITITYDTTVQTLPEGTLFIQNQGIVTGNNFNASIFYSSDPDTTSGGQTLTPVGFTLSVGSLPQTGQAPWWRVTLISLVIAGGLAILVYLGLKKYGIKSDYL